MAGSYRRARRIELYAIGSKTMAQLLRNIGLLPTRGARR
jgi:hypothetical protein